MSVRFVAGAVLLTTLVAAWWLRFEESEAACTETVTTSFIPFDRRILQRTIDGQPVALPSELTHAWEYEGLYSANCRLGTYVGNGPMPGFSGPSAAVRVLCEYVGGDLMVTELLGNGALQGHGEKCEHKVRIGWRSEERPATSYKQFRAIMKRFQ